MCDYYVEKELLLARSLGHLVVASTGRVEEVAGVHRKPRAAKTSSKKAAAAFRRFLVSRCRRRPSLKTWIRRRLVQS